MLVETIRQPSQKGTAKLVERFGERLVCVRYRVHHEKRKRYKTAEIIVQDMDWHGAAPSPNAPARPHLPPRPWFPCASASMKKTYSGKSSPSAANGIAKSACGTRLRHTYGGLD